MDDRVASGSPYEETVGFSRAVRTGRHVYVSGTAPLWPDGSAADTVRTRTYLTDRSFEGPASQADGEVFADVRPASTMLVVVGMLDPRWVVEVELDAVLPGV